MKLYVTRTGIAHRGITKNKGDVIEEGDNNHIGALQSVGCESYDELRHKPEPKRCDRLKKIKILNNENQIYISRPSIVTAMRSGY